MESTPPTDRDIDVLCVGRQQPQKRYDRLIEAVGVLRNRGHELRVALAGDGAEREALLALVEKLGLENQVELLGRRSDVFQLYARSKVFALTSEREGHPLALLEAMSRGCVPVALDCRTGPREIIRSDVDGVLLRRDASVAEIAQGIERVLTDDDRRSEMSLAAVEGMERFSTEAVDVKWKRLLAGVL
jgi:glycosyltransferase involved in cell wall biosynthesis